VSPVGHLYLTLRKRHGEKTALEICRFSFVNIKRVLEMLDELNPGLKAASELGQLYNVMLAGDIDTWQAFKESLQEVRKVMPEHQTTRRVTEHQRLSQVSRSYLFKVFTRLQKLINALIEIQCE
jgi:hypothetical protein